MKGTYLIICFILQSIQQIINAPISPCTENNVKASVSQCQNNKQTSMKSYLYINNY